MKQKIYLFGITTALIIFLGSVFKVNHLPGAGVLLISGIITLVFLFLPVALYDNYKDQGSSQNLPLYIVTWITSFVVFTAMLFKIMHWKYAGILLTVALPFPYLVFLPVFLRITSKNKNFSIYNTVFVLLLLAINSVFSVLLSFNVSKARIDDSYHLSLTYNKLEMALDNLPLVYPSLPVNLKIDEAVRIVNEYQITILKNEPFPEKQWENNPGNLQRADSRDIAAQALLDKGESVAGLELSESLKNLILEMGKNPEYGEFSKKAPFIFDIVPPDGYKPSSPVRNLTESSLAWSLIYLDGLETNLKLMKLLTSF